MNVVIWISLVAILAWLIGLTLFFWTLYRHYSRIVKGTTKQTLQALIEDVLKGQDKTKTDIDMLKNWCATIEDEGKLHIQKIGLLRFNPFRDTGGDQSFILALVDGHDTGVILSGLYSRSGTRWYAKKVNQGKSVDHELSEEEKKALKEAKKLEE